MSPILLDHSTYQCSLEKKKKSHLSLKVSPRSLTNLLSEVNIDWEIVFPLWCPRRQAEPLVHISCCLYGHDAQLAAPVSPHHPGLDPRMHGCKAWERETCICDKMQHAKHRWLSCLGTFFQTDLPFHLSLRGEFQCLLANWNDHLQLDLTRKPRDQPKSCWIVVVHYGYFKTI